MLAILCLAPAAGLDIDTLTDRMWGEDPPRTARTALQMHVSALRRKLPGRIITTADGYRLARGPEDLELVGRLVVEAGAAAEQADWPRVMEATDEALAGWNGESFANYASELWAIGEVRRIEIIYNHLVDMRLKALLALGSNDEAVELARLDLGRDALDEARWYQLIVGLHRAGRPSEALRAFREADQIIRQEVGIPPGPALRELEHRIRLDEPGLHEIGAGAATHNLPEASTTFVGRSADLAAIESMLRAQRAVTIVGPPGVGKTRLAVEIGRMSLDRYPDGVWFSSLAPARSDADVLSIVTSSTRTHQNAATLEELAGMLALRQILLVLDNCEHVPESSRRLVSALINARGPAVVLATSRRPLPVTGSGMWVVAPLDLPATAPRPSTAAEILASPSIQLFADRAHAADPSFHLGLDTIPIAEEVCRGAGGIPLAIELAASWLPAIGVSELREILGPDLTWHGESVADQLTR